MKILIINIPTAKKDDKQFMSFINNVYIPVLNNNINLVKDQNTEVTHRFCEWGLGPVDMAYCRYMDHLAQPMVYYAARNAEKEGYDAVIINCFGDPMLWELKQALNIPVIGLGETSMMYSLNLGHKFGVVSISPYNNFEIEETVEKYGLTKRFVGCESITSWEKGDQIEIEETINAFTQAARKLIDKGAEVIIPGCSVTSFKIRAIKGITEIDNVPIVDIIGVAIKQAEMFVSMKKSGSSWISRKNLYHQPNTKTLETADYLLSNENLTFWDIKELRR